MYKLLIVDDNQDLNEMFQIAFEDEKDFVLESATSGIECMEKIKTFTPDAVLLDIMMPNGDGYEVIKMIRSEKKYNNVLIIANTNLEQKKDEEKALQVGADYYLRKSEYAPSELVRVIKAILTKNESVLWEAGLTLHGKGV